MGQTLFKSSNYFGNPPESLEGLLDYLLRVWNWIICCLLKALQNGFNLMFFGLIRDRKAKARLYYLKYINDLKASYSNGSSRFKFTQIITLFHSMVRGIHLNSDLLNYHHDSDKYFYLLRSEDADLENIGVLSPYESSVLVVPKLIPGHEKLFEYFNTLDLSKSKLKILTLLQKLFIKSKTSQNRCV